ncbi:MAG: bifunctional 4-hydroxy-2-oxoglutarate aldolase/2-dehydro-3-deoxy-phosphogluconate aldolase [Thermoguttaceae bacterium]|jgi:2-dehydro-3-deoxyphosphogluconate aldolase/(4S)-4-hydroxy-2-oxoglutarate aldolase
MLNDSVLRAIERFGVVPVIAIDAPDAAIPLADALAEGGLPLAEITFRTEVAAQVIERIALERPSMLVGAGTVLTAANLAAAKSAGASFAVAPGLNAAIVGRAAELKIPFVPGVCTPSEIEQAFALKCRLLKFFPAEASGGAAMLQALSAPYAHLGVRFMPTGGVNPDNLAEYLALPSVAAVGGTWIAKREDLVAGRWQEIRRRCQAAVEIVRRVRGRGDSSSPLPEGEGDCC